MRADAYAALLMGERGLLYDVVAGVLSASGMAVAPHDDSDAGVAVAIDPDDAQWVEGRTRSLPLVVVTSRPLTIDEEVDAVRRGADAIVSGDAEPGELVRTVCTVAGGGSALAPELVRRIVADLRDRAGFDDEPPLLTAREEDILASIDRGDSVKQTASALGISAKTVENLQSRLYRKLGVRNRAQAVAKAHATGLLPGPGGPVPPDRH